MKTVDNDELSNLVLTGELTQEEAITMTDDKEQLLRMIKNKRWTRHYLRALIYQKHAIEKAKMLNASFEEIKMAIDNLNFVKSGLKRLANSYSDEIKEIERKRGSYRRLSHLKEEQRNAIRDIGVPMDQWPADILRKDERLKRAKDYMSAQMRSLRISKDDYERLRSNVNRRSRELMLDDKIPSLIRDQINTAKEMTRYSEAQKLSGYAAIASAFDDLFQMMADAMLA